ncbi:hypothetical protein GQ42DRAFT_181770 [Ramicandelaber brevisporus]|nr:hypothetical protein GQ42DRAFT_181770 [Ramicandelaber brevisporus]
MDAPPGRIPERGAEIEQQQQQPTVTEIIPDIFYTSICVASDATRDEILDAGVQAVVAYVKSDNPQSELDTIFTAFSTLYDPEARAAYDKYGQEMSTTVVEFSGTAPSHPDAANAMTSKPWIVVAVLLGSIVGSMTTSLLNSQSALYVAGSALIGYLHGNWITSNLPQVIHLKNVLAKIWSMAFGHHHSQQSLVAEEGESGESEPLLNGTNSTKTEQGRLIRNYGLKLLFDQLQQLPPFIIVTVVIFMMKIAIFTDGGFNTQHILALYNIGSGVFAIGCILRSIPRFVEIIRNKGMTRQRKVRFSQWYSHGTFGHSSTMPGNRVLWVGSHGCSLRVESYAYY